MTARIITLEEAVAVLQKGNRFTQRLVVASMVLSVLLTGLKVWLNK